jgi:hypothetical protein
VRVQGAGGLRVKGFVVRRTPTPIIADEAVIARLLDAVPISGPAR